MSRLGLRSRIALLVALIAFVAALTSSAGVLWVAERALADRAEQQVSALSEAAALALGAVAERAQGDALETLGPKALTAMRRTLADLIPSAGLSDAALL